jgi:hypothetical protein
VVKRELVPLPLDLSSYGFGAPQRSGAMTVVPLFGRDANGRFAPPLSGLKLSAVKGYGNMELENHSRTATAIVPLHMGYVQHGAQNHALCRSAFIGPGQKLMFKDACCVQQAQGGYLKEKEQWFFILPLQVRADALSGRGAVGYGKLWPTITKMNKAFGFMEAGHLEQLISRQRGYLTQYQSRFELLPGQTGAIFVVDGRLAGVEVAPSAAYFEEVWMPLVCFAYGGAAMYVETVAKKPRSKRPALAGKTVAAIRRSLDEERLALADEVRRALLGVPQERFALTEEERYLDLRLVTAEGANFCGQVVLGETGLVYASIAAKPEFVGI